MLFYQFYTMDIISVLSLDIRAVICRDFLHIGQDEFSIVQRIIQLEWNVCLQGVLMECWLCPMEF